MKSSSCEKVNVAPTGSSRAQPRIVSRKKFGVYAHRFWDASCKKESVAKRSKAVYKEQARAIALSGIYIREKPTGHTVDRELRI